MTATAPAPATATALPHFYRPHHPFASSHGDASYALMLPERSRRAEGHARKPSELAPFRDTQHSTSHFHPHSEPQVPASAAPAPASPPSYCPRVEVRASSLSQLCHPSPTPSLRASMSFAHTNATLTWGSSSAWSPSSSFASAPSSSSSASPSTSRVRHHEERRRHLVHTEADGDVSEMNDERSAGEELEAIARRGALISPIRPSQTLRPLSFSSDNNRHGSSSSSSLDGLWYSSRQDSWSPESRRPTLPSFTQLQLPNPIRPVYPEFIQGSSRPGSRPTSSSLYRGTTASPPPSPSPSTSSVSTSSPSGDRDDTDPTDEDEYVYIKREPESVKLPPLQLPEWMKSEHLYHPKPQAQVAPSSSSSASPSASPFGFRTGRNSYDLPTTVSDLRTHVLSSSEESLPPLSSPPPRWTAHHDGAHPRGRPAPQHPRNAPPKDTPTSLCEGCSPTHTPKRFRFVASKPQVHVAAAAEMHDDDAAVERGRTSDAPAPSSCTSGTKRRHAHISPPPVPTAAAAASVTASADVASSATAPSTATSSEDTDGGPRKRAPRQQPFDIGLFPASSEQQQQQQGGSRMVRGPRGAIVPAYHYDTERALKCAFAACGAVLSGKKSETASHMRSHFLQQAAGAGTGTGETQTLLCPWTVEGEDGQRVRCAMPFKDSANFGRHVSSKHIRAEEYQCNRCGRPFARRDAALRHMKTLCRVDAPVPGRRQGGGRRKTGGGAKVEEDDYYMYDD